MANEIEQQNKDEEGKKENPENTGKIPTKSELYQEKPGGIFKEGNPGKPKGAISVISKLKELLKEVVKTSDGKERERLETLARNIIHMAVNEQDKDMIKLIVSYIDGLPRQPIDFGLQDTIESVEIIMKNKNETDIRRRQKHNEDISEESERVAGQEEPDNNKRRGNGKQQDIQLGSADGTDNDERENRDNDNEKDVAGT